MSELLSDRVAKNLMYIEAVADIDRGHWEVGRERRGELTSLQKKEVEGRRRKGREEEGEAVYKYTVLLTFALSVSGVGFLSLAIVSWMDSPLTIPAVTWKVHQCITS